MIRKHKITSILVLLIIVLLGIYFPALALIYALFIALEMGVLLYLDIKDQLLNHDFTKEKRLINQESLGKEEAFLQQEQPIEEINVDITEEVQRQYLLAEYMNQEQGENNV